MTIIGVTGGTGSGKSTFCKLLAKKIPGSEIIDGDAILNETLLHYGEAFFGMFGERIQPDAEGRVKIRFFTEHPERVKEAMAIAGGYLGGGPLPPFPEGENEDARYKAHLFAAVKMARDYMSERFDERLGRLGDEAIAIVDWANLPALDIWKMCDVKIVMTADDSQRFLRLKNRKKSRRFTEPELWNMIENAALPYGEIDCDARLFNDRIETLERAADEIAQPLLDAHKIAALP